MADTFIGAALARRSLMRLGAAALVLPALPHIAKAAPRAGAGLGFLQTRMPFWGSAGLAPAGLTLTSALTAESPFSAVQLVYLNSDTTAHRVDAAAVAPTVMLSDATNPVNPLGIQDSTLWQPVTFGGKQSGVMPAAVQGNTGIFPGNDLVHGMLVSDTIPLASLPRTDGVFPLLLTRSYSAGSMPCSMSGDTLVMSPVGGGAFDAASNGRIVRAGMLAGDVASSPGLSQGTPVAYLAPSAVIFHVNVASLAVIAGGDSMYQGYGTATHQNDPFHIAACALSTPALPVTVCKVAYQGMSSASFQANVEQMIIACSPNFAFIKGASHNDILFGTQAGYQASLNGLVGLGDWCAGRGIQPASTTEIAFGQTVDNEPYRLAFNNQLRGSGWYIADWDAAVTDGGYPAAIQSQYSSFELAPHPNDAGDFAISASTLACLQKYLAT
ncbi:MAG: hypothetical protein ACRYHQ_15935 [Janthinobacterium lividum]